MKRFAAIVPLLILHAAALSQTVNFTVAVSDSPTSTGLLPPATW